MPLLKDSNPELLTELIPGKNEHLDLGSLNTNSSKKAWWQCSKHKSHQWESIVSGRAVKGYGCPFCSGLRTLRQDSFAAHHAKLLAEWHPTKNDGIDPWSISPQSNKDAWWRCGNDPKHEWTTTVKHRVIYGSGCRQCLNIRSPLSASRPDIALEWHPTKNLPLTPDQVSTGSKKRVWWRCSFDPAFHRVAQHGFQIGEVVALGADSSTRRVVPTGHVAAAFLARSEIEANFHGHKMRPEVLQFKLGSRHR